MSGLISAVPVPRLLKPAIVSVPSLLVAPTVYVASYIPGGASTVPQDDPPLPAEATTMIPAALTASTVCSSSAMCVSSHPSSGGQLHELLMMCGAIEG